VNFVPRPSPTRRVAAALSLCLCAAAGLSGRTARAGNREINPLGNEAAVAGGAVVALGRDTGQIYYNPAGIAAIQRTSFNLSTQALQFRARVVPNAVVADLPGGHRDGATLTSIQLLAMPSSLAVTRHLGRGVTIGAGYFTPEYDYYDYGAGIQATHGDAQYRARVQTDGWILRYHIGPSIGWQPHPRFRIGMSAFLVYGWRREEGRLWIESAAGTPDDRVDATLTGDLDSKRTTYGGELVFGMQWEFVKNLHLGLSFRTPRFVAHERHRSYSLVTATHQETGREDSSLFQFDDTPDTAERGRVTPMRFTAGLAYALPNRRGWVSLEMDGSPRLRLSARDVDIRPVWNIRAGARVRTAENMYFGIGAFTDHEDEVRTRDFPHFRMNYYGATTGVEFFSPVRLGRKERARTIVFSTCIGVRYAYGRGSAAQVVFDLRNIRYGLLGYSVSVLEPVAFHLIAGHLGMGTYF
jgi:hypothetical protein